jgi:peptide/nickel transport system ATP-binding protein
MSPDTSNASHRDLLRVEGLEVAFEMRGEPHPVLKGISFRVPPGRVVALVGESGSGKSVTAQATMGLLPPNAHVTGGRILFSDPKASDLGIDLPVDMTSLPPDGETILKVRGQRISMIFQEPMNSLSPLHTIGDQVSEALTIHQPVDAAEARARTEAMLARVGFPDPARAFDMYAFELSGGLRQRAMIAMALMCDPALLIADEPTTALDVTIQAQILGLLKRLQRDTGMGLLLITHDLGVVANMADEVVVVYHGEIMEAGPVDDILRRPRHPYLKALLGAVPHFDMQPGERLVSLRDVPAAAHAPHTPRPAAPAAASSERHPLLRLEAVTKSFTTRKGRGWFSRTESDEVRAVDRVSLNVHRGECVGLVGESGCGKTTLSKMIMRALTPDSGAIRLTSAGRSDDLARLSERELDPLRRHIQMVFQDPAGSLSPRMTVLNILREPMQIAGQGSRNEQVARAVDLMQAVGLDPRFLGRYPHSFSGGQRQRIGIARALALSPDLLILDEPVSALDVSVQAQVLNLLNDLRAEMGLAYLFISHNLAVVDYVADRIAVMARGRIVEIAPRESLFERPSHPYTRALLSAVPYPDLDRQLDFAALERQDASNPDTWPAAFRADPISPEDVAASPQLVDHEIHAGHLVLARQSADASELIPS